MKFGLKYLISSASISLIAALCFGSAMAQGQANVSVVNLSVQPGKNGGQMVLTPRGFLVPLPGGGASGSTVQIYMGANGGYWYVDRTGQTVDLTSYVQQIRSQTAQAQQATPPQYAPYAANETQSSNGGSSTLATATAAGVGAMAGAATAGLASAAYYNNVPYGTRMYYGQDGRPYYNDREGKNVFVNEDGDVKWNNVYAANQVQNNRQQQQIDQAKAAQQQHQTAQTQQAQQAMQMRQYSQQNSQRYQQQQNWYQDQSRDQKQAKSWQQASAGENPFVRQGDDGGRFQGSEASGRRGDRDGGGFGGGRDGAGFGGGGRGARGGGRRGR